MRSRIAAALWLFLLVGSVIVLVAGLCGCPRPTPSPPAPPPMPGGYALCPANAPRPVADDVCERKFTADGYACTKCPAAASGCYLQVYSVYCVEAGNCADPRCQIDNGP